MAVVEVTQHNMKKGKPVFIFPYKNPLFILVLIISMVAIAIPLANRSLVSKNLTYGDLPIIREFFPSQKVITERITEEVLPKKGYQTKIILGNVIPELISYEVIDKGKVEELYKSRGGLSYEQRTMLEQSSTKPLVVTQQNAVWLVNMLWALGLSNKMEVNNQSPVAGKDVNNFASTGGWNLGKEENGGIYFNKFPIISLTSEQETRVKMLAESIYRPCCNNSTFFQDCNHGSAALAVIELGVIQDLSDQEIYKTVLAFNSFWFPQNYVETALYLKKTKNLDWKNVDSKLILSKDYSSITGWQANVDAFAQKIPGLLPTTPGGGNCGA